jgi:hypothetical protein
LNMRFNRVRNQKRRRSNSSLLSRRRKRRRRTINSLRSKEMLLSINRKPSDGKPLHDRKKSNNKPSLTKTRI